MHSHSTTSTASERSPRHARQARRRSQAAGSQAPPMQRTRGARWRSLGIRSQAPVPCPAPVRIVVTSKRSRRKRACLRRDGAMSYRSTLLPIPRRGSERRACPLGVLPSLSKRADCRSPGNAAIHAGDGVAVEKDDLEQRVCRQRRDDRSAWPSDSRVITLAATRDMFRAYARF